MNVKLVPGNLLLLFFNDTATTDIYTLSLHDALPISRSNLQPHFEPPERGPRGLTHRAEQVQRLVRHLARLRRGDDGPDRKSTRLNSSHANISYAVFCLKKKKKKEGA